MKRSSAFLLGGAAALSMLSIAVSQPSPVSADSFSAAGDFAAAGQAYEVTLKATPADATALAGLARVRLYENKNDEAIALAQRALDAQPDFPPARQVSGVARQRKAAFEGDLYKVAESRPEITIPFAITDPLPVVQVTLGGRQAWFLIDTGLAGGGITAPKATLDEAGVVVDLSKGQTGVGGGGPVTYYPFSAGATLGSLTVENVPGIYIQGADALGVLPFKTTGTLSHAFFRHSRLTFDFDAMKLLTEQCGS